MSLPHAILGLLNYEAMTGYDLKRNWFDRSMRFFWPADQAQIYRTLDSLVERGWATFSVEPGRDRPNRKIYALTEAGRAELNQWLVTAPPLPTVRDPLLVQLFCAGDLDDAAIARLLRAARAEHQARLDAYDGIAARLPSFGEGKRLELWRLVVANGLGRERAYLDWLNQALALFPVPDPDDAAPDAGAPPGHEGA